MKIALLFVWTIAGAVAGMFVLGELGPLFGYRAMEGQAAYFAVMAGAPVGGVAGLIGALLFARANGGNRRRLAIGLLAPLLVAVAVPLGIYLYEAVGAAGQITRDGRPFNLGFQLRLPEGAPSPAGARLGIKLVSSKETPECDVYDAPYGLTVEGGRFIVSGKCDIAAIVPERTLVVRIGDEPTYVYDLRVAARPTSASYSEWFAVDAVVDNGDKADGARRAPHANEISEIRYAAR